eukprot:TRINITY_DN72062_c0_g1_i1.p1 TRINITY_DN72062_c0_g1~~TRINITY_DN72062_c0_g1_i1.p1  ORF type:complete len:295 (-),score=27.36 TRINITY_DN72062_c0_g1_i1:155-943(-)
MTMKKDLREELIALVEESYNLQRDEIDVHVNSLKERDDKLEEKNKIDRENGNKRMGAIEANLGRSNTRISRLETNQRSHSSRIYRNEAKGRTIEGRNLPVGSIIAWMGAYSGESLPSNWLLCDGRYISSGPMRGKRTPRLNNDGRFLRGTTGTLRSYYYQNDMMLKHTHSVYDPGHKHTDRGHQHKFESYGTLNHHEGDDADDRRMVKPEKTGHHTYVGYANLNSAKTGVRVGDPQESYSAEVGSEVRPKNMLVNWIIKISD